MPSTLKIIINIEKHICISKSVVGGENRREQKRFGKMKKQNMFFVAPKYRTKYVHMDEHIT